MKPKKFLAYGDGYSRECDSLEEAISMVEVNGGGSIYVRLDITEQFNAAVDQAQHVSGITVISKLINDEWVVKNIISPSSEE
jgi:hypothetical protein